MSVYIDSSVLVRVYSGQAKPLRSWGAITKPVASALIEVEYPRAIDSLRRAGELSEEHAVIAAADGRTALRGFQLIEIDAVVRLRAGGPLALSHAPSMRFISRLRSCGASATAMS